MDQILNLTLAQVFYKQCFKAVFANKNISVTEETSQQLDQCLQNQIQAFQSAQQVFIASQGLQRIFRLSPSQRKLQMIIILYINPHN